MMIQSLSIPPYSFLDRLRSTHLGIKEQEEYVALNGSRRSSLAKDFILDNETTKFLQGPKKILLLLGNAGSGKSIYCKQLARRLPISIYIELGNLKNTTDNFISHWLIEQGLTPEEIIKLKLNHDLVLFLDGYDETGRLNNLYVTNKLSEWRCKVIITCRSEYLYQVKNYYLYFVPYEGEVAQTDLFDEINIKEFNQEQITAYLEHYTELQKTAWNLQTYQEWLGHIPDLKELLSTPFFLKVIVESLPSIVRTLQDETERETKLQLMQVKIYDTCMQAWFARQELKLKASGRISEDEDIKPEFWAYAKQLAEVMLELNVITVEHKEESDLWEEIKNPWHRFFDENNLRISLLKTSYLFRQVEPDRYSSINGSLIKYFARCMMNETLFPLVTTFLLPEGAPSTISQMTADTLPVISQGKQGSVMDYFNKHLFTKEPDALRFWADSAEIDDVFKTALFAYIEASKKTEEIKVAAANAITVLNLAKVAFSAMDLSHIKIPMADLTNGIFHDTDLSYSDLTGVKLRNANLCGAKLQYSTMLDVTFDENPSLFGHKGIVYNLDVSANGSYIISGSADQTIRIWARASKFPFDRDIKDISEDEAAPIYECIKILAGHGGQVYSVVLSSDGRLIISSSGLMPDSDIIGDFTVRIWDIATDRCLKILKGHEGEVLCVSVSPDNRHVISGSRDTTIRIWPMATDGGFTDACLKILAGHGSAVSSVSVSPNSCYIISGSWDTTIRIWDMATGQRLKTLKGHTGRICSVRLSLDGCHIISSSGLVPGSGITVDNTVRIWDIATGDCKILRGHTNEIFSVSISNDGKYIISGSRDNTICIWDMATYECLRTLAGHLWVYSARISPDNRYIISTSMDRVIHIWDMAVREKGLLQRLEGHRAGVFSVSVSPDDRYLISGGADCTVFIWNIETRKRLKSLMIPKIIKGIDYAVTCVSVSPDGRHIIFGSRDKTIRIWDMTTDKQNLKTIKGHEDEVACVSISSDNYYIISCSAGLRKKLYGTDFTIRIWSMKTGECLQVLKGHTARVYSVSVSRDVHYIISGSQDCTIRIWDMGTYKCLKTLTGHEGDVYSVTLSPNDCYIISGSEDRTVRIWDIKTYKCLRVLKGHGSRVSCLTVSSDSRQVISGSEDFDIHVWDIMTGKCLQILAGHTGGVTSVSLSPNSQTLVSGSGDRSIKIWKRISDHWVLDTSISVTEAALACQAAGITGASLSAAIKKLLEQKGCVCGIEQDEFAARLMLTAIKLKEEGNCLFKEKCYKEALLKYDAAIEAAPDLAPAWLNKGIMHFYLNQHRLALTAFDKALAIDPNYSKAKSRREAVLSLLAQTDKEESLPSLLRFSSDPERPLSEIVTVGPESLHAVSRETRGGFSI